MINTISFLVLLICCWALIASNLCLLKKNDRLFNLNKRLITTLHEKNQLIDFLYDILVQHEYYDENSFGEIYKAASEYLRSMGYDADGLEFDVKPYKLFERLMKSKGYERPIDDIFFVDHEEFFPFDYNGDSYVIEVFW